MSTTELEAKCRELRQLQSLIEEAQLAAQGVDELRAGEYRVAWKPVTTMRVDAKAFQQAFPGAAQAFTKTITTRRFCVA